MAATIQITIETKNTATMKELQIEIEKFSIEATAHEKEMAEGMIDLMKACLKDIAGDKVVEREI